jgi:preprotein translocase subunit SecG
MNTLITVLHVLAAFSLILTVLLQAGKGAAMGSGLGGGSSQTMFGSSGAGNFLTKLTTGIAILFMVTSLTLATISNKSKSSSVIQSVEDSVPDVVTEPVDSSDNSSNQ